MNWPPDLKAARAELDAAERDVAHYSVAMRHVNEEMLRVERLCSEALVRRDAAEAQLRRLEQS